MTDAPAQTESAIPEQPPLPWSVAYAVSWAGLRRRMLRALLTMSGVILAIAFLAYMLITDSVTQALIAVNDDRLNMLLQRTGVDIFSEPKTDEMMLLLIGLSLLTCLVGIVNSMLMSVAERVREIGTLKCLGARDSFIVKTYLIESSLQGIAGAIIGMLMGCIVAIGVGVVNYGAYTLTNLPFLAILKALVISFAIGSLLSIAASIAPAYMAAKKQPVDALRVEE